MAFKTPTKEEKDKEKMEWIRAERLHLLECSENPTMNKGFGIGSDRPYTADQLEWRQKLRDLPATISPDDISEDFVDEKWVSPVTGDVLAENNLELDDDSTAEPGIEPMHVPGHYGYACDHLFPEPPAGFEALGIPDDEFKKSGGTPTRVVNQPEINEETGRPTGKVLNPDGINYDANGPLKGQDGWWLKKYWPDSRPDPIPKGVYQKSYVPPHERPAEE